MSGGKGLLISLRTASVPLPFCRNNSKRRAFWIAAAGVVLCVVIYAGIGFLQVPLPLVKPEVLERTLKIGLEGETVRNKYVVETLTCQIPEMDPKDQSIRHLLRPDYRYQGDCESIHKAWAFMNGTVLQLNVSAIHKSGYSMDSIHCCYRIIQRVQQPLSHYDLDADMVVRYSDKCYPISKTGTEIDTEFLRVHCVSKLPPFYNDVVYRDFFAVVQPSSDRLVPKKLFQWKQKSSKTSPPPPNVAIIGIDNNCRMNSHRYLKKTLETLRSLGAVELLGYTKVGENTFPNLIPFLSGYSEEQLMSICFKTYDVLQDNCPYIWKAFDKADYVTVHAEDCPYLGAFNFDKAGHVRKPTDFYLRPVMLAVTDYMPRFEAHHLHCIGRHRTEQFMFKYLLDAVRLANSNFAPVFIHSWVASLAHLNFNNLQFGDASISSFIHSLVNVTNDNTIFFFMSDHGQRHGPMRATAQGWYEDKLPTQWIYLPQRIKALYPEWSQNLETNSRRLTSTYDGYKTLLHILKTFGGGNVPKEIYEAADHQYGISLFEPIPENRTCEDAGVPVNSCACQKVISLNISDPNVTEAAEVSVKHLASLMPLDVCAEPTLKNIVTAGYLDLDERLVYVITFVTEPGDFLFEVNVEKEADSGKFLITTDLLRMNKITRKADCVKTPLLERYCYCK